MVECTLISSLVVGNFSVQVKALSADGSTGGLALHWTARLTKKNDSKILLSEFAKSASLFPGELSPTQVAALANSKRASAGGCISDSESAAGAVSQASCAFVLTDLGDLLLALFEDSCCKTFFLGRLPCPVLWVGTINGGDAALVCAVQPSGVLHLCRPVPPGPRQASDSALSAWKAVPLNARVIAACTFANFFITSDGFSVHIYELKVENAKANSTVCSCFSCREIALINKVVKFPGVVSLTFSGSNVLLATVDGRRYCKFWSTFLSEGLLPASDSSSARVKAVDDVGHSRRLKELKDIGELTSRVSDQSEALNFYIKQFNLAQHLLSSSCGGDFNVTYSVQSCVDPSYVCRLELQMTSKERGVELGERWWYVRLGVPDGRKMRFISAPFKKQHRTVAVRLTSEEVNFLVFSSNTPCRPVVKLDLVFMDWAGSKPLVCVTVAQLKLCVWKFLSEKQILSKLACKESSPLEYHLKCYNTVQNGASAVTGPFLHTFSFEYPTSSAFLSKLCRMLHVNETPDESSLKINKLLFYGPHSVMVKANATPHVLKIVISCSSAFMAVALKRNLDESSRELCLRKRDRIVFDVLVVEQIQNFQCFLDATMEDSLQISNVRKLCSDLYAIVGALP